MQNIAAFYFIYYSSWYFVPKEEFIDLFSFLAAGTYENHPATEPECLRLGRKWEIQQDLIISSWKCLLYLTSSVGGCLLAHKDPMGFALPALTTSYVLLACYGREKEGGPVGTGLLGLDEGEGGGSWWALLIAKVCRQLNPMWLWQDHVFSSTVPIGFALA